MACDVKHPALTALDRQSMVAAYTASFRGIFGRDPTWMAGSGVDDGNYWISVADHYGEFSDGICRAGWSAYWEHWLEFGNGGDPRLGDQPARFKPSGPTPEPSPTPGDPYMAKLDAIHADVQTLLNGLRKFF